MILIIGGFAQGKLHYVEQHYVQREDRQEVPVLDGTLRLASDSKITWATESAVETMPGKQTEQPTGRQTAGPQVIVNHLHRYIREQLRQGTDPEAMIANFYKEYPDCILICARSATASSPWKRRRELTENVPAEFWKGWRRRQMRW